MKIIGSILLLASVINFLALSAQPEPRDAGIFIKSFFVKGEKLLNGDNTWIWHQGNNQKEVVYIRHYLLDNKFKPGKKAIEPVDPSAYFLAEKAGFGYGLFLPPHLKGKACPNQRLVISLNTDTMVIDFFNIPEKGYELNVIEQIHFYPGKFYLHADEQKIIPKPENKEMNWICYYRSKGITPETIKPLVKLKALSYYLDYNKGNNFGINRFGKKESYTVPEIKVLQTKPDYVRIKLNGSFIGYESEASIETPLVNLVYQLEYLENGNWNKLGFFKGIEGLSFTDSNLRDAYYDDQLFQVYSLNNPGTKPGQYRMKVVSCDKKVITSEVFTLGIMKSKGVKYQLLYPESIGFPCYSSNAPDNLNLYTSHEPILKNDTLVYYFLYHRADDNNSYYYPKNPENTEMQLLIADVLGKKISVNGTPFDGIINYAFQYVIWNKDGSRIQTDVYKIIYSGGKRKDYVVYKDINDFREDER